MRVEFEIDWPQTRQSEGEASDHMTGPQREDLKHLDEHLCALMARAQRGDTQAYAEVLSQARTLTQRYLAHRWRGISSDHHEDIVQDVLIAVHGARATFDGRRSFLAWLRAIGKNRAADYFRRQQRYNRALQHYGLEPVTLPPDETNVTEDQATVAAYLEGLPQAQREAIDLVRVEGLSMADAASRAGIGVGAMRVRVHRALKALKALAHNLGKVRK